MKILGPWLLLAALAYAQPFEIRGVVMEVGTNHGIEDAEIVIRKVARAKSASPPEFLKSEK